MGTRAAQSKSSGGRQPVSDSKMQFFRDQLCKEMGVNLTLLSQIVQMQWILTCRVHIGAVKWVECLVFCRDFFFFACSIPPKFGMS